MEQFLALMKESFWIFLIAALLFLALAVWFFASARKAKKRLKKLKKESADSSKRLEALEKENDFLRAELEVLSAKTAQVPAPRETAPVFEDGEPEDAPLLLDEVLAPDLFGTTDDGGAIEIRVPGNGVRYTVKFDRDKNDWAVRKDGQARAVRRAGSKEEALKIAKELANRQKTGAGK